MRKKLIFLFKTLLVCVLILSLSTVPAFALTWDGAASSGSSGSGETTGAYEVGYLEAAKASGYRFSVVNSSGAVQKSPVDVFRYATNTSHINRSKLAIKYAKSELKNLYASTSFSTTTSTAGCNYDTNLGLSLPELTTGMEAWCVDSNLNQLFSSVGWGITASSCNEKGWSVLVEPIFAVKLNGENCVFTVTEIASFGGYVYGWDNYVSSSASSTSWANISYYTNKDWPNSLRAENGYGLFTPAAALSTHKTPFKTIITSGYGVAILYGENLTKPTSYVLDVNGHLDGKDYSSLSDYGTFDVYVNGSLVANDVNDYAAYLAKGATFQITDIKATTGHTYHGAFGGSLSGTITANVTTWLNFTTNKYTIVYEGNGATSGSTASQTAKIEEWVTLNSNGFKKELAFKYDGNGGISSIAEETKNAEFVGWLDLNNFTYEGNSWPWYVFDAPFYANYYSNLYNAFGYNKQALIRHWFTYNVNGTESRSSSPVFNLKYYMKNGGSDLITAFGSNAFSFVNHWRTNGYAEKRPGISSIDKSDANVYPNNAKVANLSTTPGDTVTLTAKWRDVTITLPTVTRDGHTLVGWNTKQDGTVTQYNVGDKVTSSKGLTFYAQWKTNEDFTLAGISNITIKVGDVFNPMTHLNAFTFPEGCEVALANVIYNGVPRDTENKATTSGTGYTVVYNIVFKNGTYGQYRLIVTVLDEDAVVSGSNGFIRFIAHKYLYTLNENSKWREDPLKSVLEDSLAINEPTDENAVEVWHFSPSDVQDVKAWLKKGKEEGKSREELNAEFKDRFSDCKTK